MEKVVRVNDAAVRSQSIQPIATARMIPIVIVTQIPAIAAGQVIVIRMILQGVILTVKVVHQVIVIRREATQIQAMTTAAIPRVKVTLR